MPGSAGGSNSNISNTKLEVDTTTTNSHKSSRRGSTTYPRSSLTTRNGDSVAEAAVAFLASPDSLGFSLASKKRNTDFHDLFPTLPRDDLLVDDFSCAWQKEVLIQGRMYISERHVCFYANILGWVHSVELPFASITALEKRNVAAIIPNAIEVSVGDVKYFFASFLHREESFCLLVRLWDLS
ncbi:GRAM domain-containing protein, partial [Fimicolochytrium jonesii]|uniref:GRAM domain-containing protein n=1 Tax=Fimicolochytrium jonesii TaxID=1396493 RepID=UPI0022FDF132